MATANNVNRQLNTFVERVIKTLVLDLTANLVQATPIDTGWARANWIPNIGSSFQGTAGTRAEAEAGNIQLGDQENGISSVVTQYTLARGPVYITNNVPYIVFLNEGSSRQAPSAYVQSQIVRSLSAVATRFRRVRLR